MFKRLFTYSLLMMFLLGLSYLVNTSDMLKELSHQRIIDVCLTIFMIVLAISGLWEVAKAVIANKHKLNNLSFKKIALVIVTLFAFVAALAVEIGDMGIRNQSIVYDAKAIALSSNLVKLQLGPEVRLGWPISGAYHFTDISGSADIYVPIIGPKGKGKLHIEGRKNIEGWKIDVLDFKSNDDGQRIWSLDASGQ